MNFDGYTDIIYVEEGATTYDIRILLLNGCQTSCTYTLV